LDEEAIIWNRRNLKRLNDKAIGELLLANETTAGFYELVKAEYQRRL